MREKRLGNREGRDLPKVMQSWFLPWDQSSGTPALSPQHMNYCFKVRTPNLAPPATEKPSHRLERDALSYQSQSFPEACLAQLPIGPWDPPPSGFLPLLCKFWERGHS